MTIQNGLRLDEVDVVFFERTFLGKNLDIPQTADRIVRVAGELQAERVGEALEGRNFFGNRDNASARRKQMSRSDYHLLGRGIG